MEANAQEYKEVDFHLTSAMQTLSAVEAIIACGGLSNVMNHPPPITLGSIPPLVFGRGRLFLEHLHHFEWYLPGKIGICYGYVSFRECTETVRKFDGVSKPPFEM